jgi:hypothetical protein
MKAMLKSRWFRLSTLAIVIAVAFIGAWLSYSFRWMHERQITRKWLDAHSNIGGSLGCMMEPRPGLAWGLMLLGEPPLDSPHWVAANNDEQSDLTEYHRRVAEIIDLFPEAQIEDADRAGWHLAK